MNDLATAVSLDSTPGSCGRQRLKQAADAAAFILTHVALAWT